ncbi:MAG: poly-beta-hydroxybutyrate-responsive repressor [Ktedonobacteraceae bacterium]|nr:poly-beta-hydroxybutyrate-responsive repressor [Ktedonobacteraceae bacterium]
MAEENKENGPRNPATDAWSKNWVVPILLLMLKQWHSYGYELMEKMATFGFTMMNPGTFYRTLRQMEKDGMVRSSWDTSEAGPARRVYSITDSGEAYLKYWAESLNQYQKMMDTFFQLYTGRPAQKKREAAEDRNAEEQDTSAPDSSLGQQKNADD